MNYSFNYQFIIFISPMAHIQVSKLSVEERAELACTYAALILHDDGQQITSEKINTLLKTAGSNTPAYYAKIFAKALEGNDINSFFNFGGSSSGSVPASQPTKAAPVAEKKAEEKGGKKQQKKKEAPPPPPEEEDVDMGDLFG